MTTRSIGTFELGPPPSELEDAELWESFRMRGLSPEQATLHVQRRARARTMASEGNQADFAKLLPGKLGTIAVNFGHGASLGIAGDKNYLAASRVANPFTALGSDIAGAAATGTIAAAAPIFAGARAGTTAAVVGGATGAVRGFAEPFPGLSRTESAALFGAGGVVGGVVLNRLLGKVGPWMTKVGGNIRQYFVKALGKPPTDPQVVALTEAVLRQNLAKQGVQPEVLERMVQQWKATPVETPPTPVLRPGETLSPIPGEPKGLQVTGPAPPLPPVPTTPTIAEMQGYSTAPRSVPQAPSTTASVANPLGNVDPNDLNVMAAAQQRAQFPITAMDLVAMSEAKGIGVEQAAEILRRFQYQVSKEAIDEAKRLTIQATSSTAGRGQTLPWYPRGGKAEQAQAPFPATSPAVPPAGDLNAPLVEFLKASKNAADAIKRLNTLRRMNVQGLPSEADLLAVLGFPVP